MSAALSALRRRSAAVLRSALSAQRRRSAARLSALRLRLRSAAARSVRSNSSLLNNRERLSTIIDSLIFVRSCITSANFRRTKLENAEFT